MLGSVRSETYCFAKLQYFPCFTKFSDVFLLLVRKIMSGEVWKHHNPAACLLPHSCQDSVSRSSEQGVYDTILTLKNRREIRRVFLPEILRRFFVVFASVVYVVDIQCDMRIFGFFVVSECRQKPCKMPAKQSVLARHQVNLAVSPWLFCSPTLTIWDF